MVIEVPKHRDTKGFLVWFLKTNRRSPRLGLADLESGNAPDSAVFSFGLSVMKL
jgi:hypothetical protein